MGKSSGWGRAAGGEGQLKLPGAEQHGLHEVLQPKHRAAVAISQLAAMKVQVLMGRLLQMLGSGVWRETTSTSQPLPSGAPVGFVSETIVLMPRYRAEC